MVKNIRTSGRIKHDRVLYLGRLAGLDEDERLELLERMERLLLYRYASGSTSDSIESLAFGFVSKYYSRRSGHSKNRDDLSNSGGQIKWEEEEERIILKSLRTLRVREIGGEWLCWQAIEELGIRSFWQEGCSWSEGEADVLLMNLMGRLLYPVSERKTAHWLEEQSGGPELLEGTTMLTEDALHRANAKLLDIHHQLEDYLYERMGALLKFGAVRFLYDMTNTYFEGRMLGSKLAQFGRSKEKRSDCPLVSIGLLTNELGFIRRSDFYAGNVSEPATFDQALSVVLNSGSVMIDAGP